MLRFAVLALAPLLAVAQERVAESIVPALAYGTGCSSTVELRNLSGRAVTVDVEGHKASGALAAIVDQAGNTVRLKAGGSAQYRLDIQEETTGAWVKVREHVASPKLAPAVAVSSSSECTVDNQLRTAAREVAFAMRSPWYSSEAGGERDGVISLINASERAARVSACYSAGSLYSVPGRELSPVCSISFEVQVPPFGSREFPLEREGSSHFSLKTVGDAIVLEMLRPVAQSVRLYTVDSSIHFGEEVKR